MVDANILKEHDIEILDALNSRVIKAMSRIFLLKTIKKGHSYGYDILKHVHCSGMNKVSRAFIYKVLSDMESENFIKGQWVHNETGPGKKEYHVTEKGDLFLHEALKRHKNLMKDLYPDSDEKKIQ